MRPFGNALQVPKYPKFIIVFVIELKVSLFSFSKMYWDLEILRFSQEIKTYLKIDVNQY